MIDDDEDREDRDVSNEGSGRAELLGGMSESIFAAAGPAMAALGWSVFPQETSGERRFPGKLHGRMIKWSEDYDLANTPPTPNFLRDCVLQCASLNVACVFGPASGNTFAVDVDVMDASMSDAIVEIAEEILGTTPFMRVGRAPKIALIYRHAPGEDSLVPSTSRHFAEVEADGTVSRSGDGLEILGATKLITMHGRHHKTGHYFKWIGSATPLLDGPEQAPVVTADQVQTFLEAVDARFRFHRGSSFKASSASLKWDEETWNGVPRIALAAGGAPWFEDGDGLVSDGREAYLTSLTFHVAARMRARLDMARDGGKELVDAVKREISEGVLGSFVAGARIDPRGRWSQRELPREVHGKVSHLVAKYMRGDLKLPSVAREADLGPDLALPAPVEGMADPELSFLRPNSSRLTNSRFALKGTVEPMPEGEPSLELPEDREPIARMIQDGLSSAFLSYFTDVYGDPVGYGDGQRSRVHVLKAPTGAGKTSLCIRTLARDPRTFADHNWKDPKTGGRRTGRAPWVMLLPTYANIDELRSRAQVLNLNGSLSDQDLRMQAEGLGLIAEDELDGKLADLRRDALNCGLDTMVYSGKLRAGCRMEEKVKLAMAAGIGTAAFCKATVRKKDPGAKKDDRGELVEEICEYYQGCKAIEQRSKIAEAHVVFMPHSFLALSIPEELEQIRGVVADERVHHLFLHTATFAATSLSIPRKPPRLTAREKAGDVQPDDLLAERDLAAHIALDAMRSPSRNPGDRCPAAALARFRPDNAPNGGAVPGLGLVRSALRVCSSAIQRDGNLSPTTSFAEVEALCKRPTGRDLREEWQFWTIIEERILSLQRDALLRETIAKDERELALYQGQWEPERRERRERSLEGMKARSFDAKGDRDHRIQFLTDPAVNGGTQELVRISWRTVPNWNGVPVLLLDASAAPPIVAKIWGLSERDIVVHDVVRDTGRALNVKIVGIVNQTFSNSSIAASAGATETERFSAARNLSNVRQAISAVSSLYGHGRVVAGTSIVLRELVNRGWACPDNVDWCHYGAMRGLDGFKFHAAAISIGRMEPPTRTIDGLVAALTYDDEVPEAPFDLRGDGCDDEAASLRLPMGDQRLRLRSGHVATLRVPTFEGRWARLIQRQYREEELMQFVGRLRPVYREGRPPVWFALSSVIPEELVVDDLIHIEDLLHGTGRLWEAVRRTNGVAEPEVLRTACPDLFRDEGAARSAMKAAGFPARPGEAGDRASQGFASYVWHDADGNERMAFVRACAPDAAERISAALGTRMPSGAPELSWAPDPGIEALARAREPDGVEQRIGPRAQRPERETENLDRVGEILISSEGEVDEQFGISFYHHGGGSFTVQQWSAKVSIDGFWEAKAGAADDRLMPLVAEGESGEEAPPYEQMGATVTDGETRPA